jgi:hypothetical protein
MLLRAINPFPGSFNETGETAALEPKGRTFFTLQ